MRLRMAVSLFEKDLKPREWFVHEYVARVCSAHRFMSQHPSLSANNNAQLLLGFIIGSVR